MWYYFENFPEKLNLVYSVLMGTLFSQFSGEDSIINPEAQRILQNPEDRKTINDAVQKLKNDPEKRKKKLTLSNNKEVIISLD